MMVGKKKGGKRRKKRHRARRKRRRRSAAEWSARWCTSISHPPFLRSLFSSAARPSLLSIESLLAPSRAFAAAVAAAAAAATHWSWDEKCYVTAVVGSESVELNAFSIRHRPAVAIARFFALSLPRQAESCYPSPLPVPLAHSFAYTVLSKNASTRQDARTEWISRTHALFTFRTIPPRLVETSAISFMQRAFFSFREIIVSRCVFIMSLIVSIIVTRERLFFRRRAISKCNMPLNINVSQLYRSNIKILSRLI